MARELDARLPEDLRRAFDGQNLHEKVGLAYVLVTNDPDNNPRICMLSAGEVLAIDEVTLRFGLWPGTRTSRNLARGVRALFAYVAPGRVLYVRGTVQSLAPVAAPRLARFALRVDSVESDEHVGMPVTAPIRFSVDSARVSEVLLDWRAQLDELRLP